MPFSFRHLFSGVLALSLISSGEVLAQAPAAAKVAGETASKSEEKQAEPGKEGEKPEAKKAEAEKGEKTAAEPATYTAKKGPLKIEVSLKGTFEARANQEISLRPKEWKTLKVVKALAHGTRVTKGEVLVEFDLEEINRLIADLTTDQELATLALKQAETNLKTLEAATPLELAAAERSKRLADEDLARFLKIERPMMEKAEAFLLKMTENSLQYEQEELRQLEKMYKADDLVEETEEIILKRQRDTVERAKFSLEVAKILYDQAIHVSLPRDEESRKQSVRKEDIALKKVQATLPVALKQQPLELAKLKVQQSRNAEKLKRLLADREMLKVVAPIDGIVYYGQYRRGEWTGASGAADDMRPGGDVTVGEVFMTILQPRPLAIRASVPEKDLHWVRPALSGKVEATGYPDLKLTATVSSVDAVPAIGNKFEAILTPNLDAKADALMPGMNCTVKFVPYLNRQATTIPASALFREELDDQQQYVYLVPKGGKPKKQPVTAGKKSDDRVEILKGLQPGDKILQEKPKDDAETK
jgi:multidrug resistance efflux pump